MKSFGSAFPALIALLGNKYVIPLIPFNKLHLPFDLKEWAISYIILPLLVGTVFWVLSAIKKQFVQDVSDFKK